MKDIKEKYSVPVFQNINILKDIEYAVAKIGEHNEKLLLDVYSPFDGTANKRPAIVWIHGGGFKMGIDKSQNYIVRLAIEFAKKGFVSFSINYRVRNDPYGDMLGSLKDAVNDAIASINFIRHNWDKYKINKNKIILAGGSSGGMIATNLCLLNKKAPQWNKSKILGLVNLWGSPGTSMMLDKIYEDFPPTLIIHGTDDHTIPYSQSEGLVRELKRKNIECVFCSIHGAYHTPVKYLDEIINCIAKFIYNKLGN